MSTTSRLALLLPALVVLAPMVARGEPAPDNAAGIAAVPMADPESIIRAELAAIAQAWNDGNLTRHMAPYADSATMMGCGGLIRGRAAIHASMERSFWRDGKPLQQLRFEEIEVRMVGGNDAAIVTGKFILSGGERPEANGRFTTIWELQDGRWVTVHDHSG
ncbi:MAG TPA: nuclear transport factor 2 family protein [Gemmatimonadales bacterium]|nr:nuclear transport factor 2 family protein [Gemmatimonadales bacterium]